MNALDYTANDQVKKIVQADKTVEFYYGSDGQRFKRVDQPGTANEITTLYLGSVELTHYSDGSRKWRRTIAGAVQVDHVQTNRTSALQAGVRSFFYKDHLGSINAITGADGRVKELLAFDPWGARRTVNRVATANTGTWSNSAMAQATSVGTYGKANQNAVTNRGFTGHEHIDEVGIIHMNGRIYDATIGRFLQADPHIDGATQCVSQG